MPIIEPKGNSQPAATSHTTASPAAQSARERAIARLTGAAPQVNQNSVSPEEMSAISNKKEEESEIVQESASEGQEDKVVEQAEEPKVEETKPAEEPISKQYAILARKEKALRASVQELNAQKAAFKAEQESFKTQAAKGPDNSADAFKQRLQRDLLGTLNEIGYSPDQITNMLLNPKQIDPAVEELREQIKALRDEQENGKKAFEDQQTRAYQQAVNEIRTEAKSLVYTSDEFETIKEMKAVDDVVELIEQTFRDEGTLLTVQEAAKAVEDYLVEEALKLAKLKKIQSRLSPVAPSKPSEQKPESVSKQPQMKTLTNAAGTTRQLSARERAILAMKGELKK